VRRHINGTPEVALVLGSGLGEFAEHIPGKVVIRSADIPHYPLSTVAGHKGRLVFGILHAVPILAFQGRVHFYETNDLHAVLYPILLAHQLGAEVLFLTNAAGGVNRSFTPGDLMLITDIMNLTLEPLSYSAVTEGAVHSPTFDKDLCASAEVIALGMQIPLKKGVYAGVKGPSYETAAEVEMVFRLGGDAVGMSTVHEVQLARRLGMRLLALSCITNRATGISSTPLSHAEVTEVGLRMTEMFRGFLEGLLKEYSRKK
jgi:purine-nucleoside phosphorylase